MFIYYVMAQYNEGHSQQFVDLVRFGTQEGALAYAQAHEDTIDFRHEDSRALREAAGNGDLNVVRYLLGALPEHRRADVHAVDDGLFGDGALRRAAMNGHLNVVRYLLDELPIDRRADIHAVDDQALRGAAMHGRLNVVRYLLDELPVNRRANIHARNDNALRLAAENGHLDVVRYLLVLPEGREANIHANNDEALRLAAKNGHLNVVRYLLGEEVTVNGFVIPGLPEGRRANANAITAWNGINNLQIRNVINAHRDVPLE